MRAGAFGSLPIGAIDLPKREVKQWPSLGVRTKKRKARTTFLLDVPDLREAVERWDSYVRCHLPTEAMWFTPILNQWGEHTLLARPSGEHRNQAVTRAMRRLFVAADLPYQSPHKFRHGHAMYALLRVRDMADYKAISLNLMHADVRVTDQVYTTRSRSENGSRGSASAKQPSRRRRAIYMHTCGTWPPARSRRPCISW
jgi:integrase